MLQQLHVVGDGEDVHEVEEDIHSEDDSQVNDTLHTDVPHLPLLPGQVRLVGLQGAADTLRSYKSLLVPLLQLTKSRLR